MAAYREFLKKHWQWCAPLFLWLVITPFSSELDLAVAKTAFYREWAHTPTGEYGFFSTPFFDFIYLWGVLPAQVISFIAASTLIASIWYAPAVRFRSVCLVLSLTLGIGSGVITHFVLKESWGRPRPRQIIDFGGNQPFRAYYQPQFKNTPEPSKSFPSGHSTCGFYFFCLYFLGKRLKRKRLAYIGMSTSLILGTVISLARIVQGGHFISDICISALIMWYTAYILDYLIYQAPITAHFRTRFYSSDDIGIARTAYQA